MSPNAKPTFTRTERLVLAGLLLLSAVPVIGGALRLTELSTGIQIIGDNERFVAVPLPVVSHIIAAVLYSVLGAFQFLDGFRQRFPKWHKRAGRLLIPAGLVVALSGLWMNQFYPLPELDGELLYALRLVFGSAMLFAIVAGMNALRQKEFIRHGAWMTRAYAIGMAAGTQVFTLLPLMLEPDLLNESTRALGMGAGWVINLCIAEWIIHRRARRRTRAAARSIQTTSHQYRLSQQRSKSHDPKHLQP